MIYLQHFDIISLIILIKAYSIRNGLAYLMILVCRVLTNFDMLIPLLASSSQK
jgi:hypothetical protein